jgi:hypothetical protein
LSEIGAGLGPLESAIQLQIAGNTQISAALMNMFGAIAKAAAGTGGAGGTAAGGAAGLGSALGGLTGLYNAGKGLVNTVNKLLPTSDATINANVLSSLQDPASAQQISDLATQSQQALNAQSEIANQYNPYDFNPDLSGDTLSSLAPAADAQLSSLVGADAALSAGADASAAALASQLPTALPEISLASDVTGGGAGILGGLGLAGTLGLGAIGIGAGEILSGLFSGPTPVAATDPFTGKSSSIYPGQPGYQQIQDYLNSQQNYINQIYQPVSPTGTGGGSGGWGYSMPNVAAINQAWSSGGPMTLSQLAANLRAVGVDPAQLGYTGG